MRRGPFSLVADDSGERPGDYWLGIYAGMFPLSRRNLERLGELINWALERERNRCEGCKRRATTFDGEGVPLCRACFNALEFKSSEASPARGTGT